MVTYRKDRSKETSWELSVVSARGCSQEWIE